MVRSLSQTIQVALLSCCLFIITTKTLAFAPPSAPFLDHYQIGILQYGHNGKCGSISGVSITPSRSNKRRSSCNPHLFMVAGDSRNEQNNSNRNLGLKTYTDFLEKLQALSFLSTVQQSDQDDHGGRYGEGDDLVSEAQQVFDKMFNEWYMNDRDELEPTIEIYNALIEVYANSNSKSSRSRGRDDGAGTAAAHPMTIPEQIVKKMELATDGSMPTPNRETYMILMNGWSRMSSSRSIGNMRKVEQVVQRLEERYEKTKDDSILPTIEVYNALLSAWLKSEMKVAPREAENILYKLMDSGKVMTVQKNQNDEDGVNESDTAHIQEITSMSTSTLQSYTGPNTKTFYLVMSCFIRSKTVPQSKKASKIQKIIELMNEWKTNNSDADVDPKHKNIFNLQIKAAPTAIDAETILFDMIDFYQKDGDINHRPNAASFINTINKWKDSRSKEAPERSIQLLDLLTELYDLSLGSVGDNMNLDDAHDLKPDRRVYSAVQNVWSRSKEKKKAYETKKLLQTLRLKQMETDDMDYTPQLRQWNNVLNACVYTRGNQREKKEAMKILVETFNEMRNLDDIDGMTVKPNHVSYGLFLKGCTYLLPASEQKESIVENIFRKCCRDGHVSEFVFTSLIEAASPELCNKLLGTSSENVYDDDGIQIPEEWARNV